MPNTPKQSKLRSLNNIIYTFFFYLILNLIKTSESSCPNGVYLSDTSCFDNIITIKKNFRAGQFATNVKGDMIVEYSNNDGNSYIKDYFSASKKMEEVISQMKIPLKKKMSNTLIHQLDMEDMNQEIYLFV